MTTSSAGWRRRRGLQAASRVKQEAERAHLQSFVDRFRAKASKAAQAQSRLKRLAKLEPVAAVSAEHVAPFTLPSPPRPLAPPLIRLEAAQRRLWRRRRCCATWICGSTWTTGSACSASTARANPPSPSSRPAR